MRFLNQQFIARHVGSLRSPFGQAGPSSRAVGMPKGQQANRRSGPIPKMDCDRAVKALHEYLGDATKPPNGGSYMDALDPL
eukprot:8529250-Pyramimonas_sp.AAC.1